MKLTSIYSFTAIAAISLLGSACRSHSSSADAARILRTEKFVCDQEKVRVAGTRGDVIIKRGEESPRIFLPSKEIVWYAEEGNNSTRNTWMAVHDTAYILVIRESSGGVGKVIYFRE